MNTKKWFASLFLLLILLVSWIIVPSLFRSTDRSELMNDPDGTEVSHSTEGAQLTPVEVEFQRGREILEREEEAPIELDLFPGVLHVFAAESGTPIAEAAVHATTLSGQSFHLISDESGSVKLPAARHWTCRVTSPGRAGRTVTVQVPEAEGRVGLTKAGSLEVRVSSELGEAIEGAELLLVPPQADGQALDRNWRMWDIKSRGYAWRPNRSDGEGIFTVSREYATTQEAEDWRQVTDSLGIARWDGLQPGTGYRVGWLSKVRVTFDPPHEQQPQPTSGGGWLMEGQPVDDCSGIVAVEEGETANVLVVPTRGTSVSGRLETGGLSLLAGALVRIDHVIVHDAEGRSSLTRHDLEYEAQPESDGGFYFEDVTPGTNRLEGVWKTEAGVVLLAGFEFELLPGEHLDLGTIEARPGSSLTLSFYLEEDGVELDLSTLSGSDDLPRWDVLLSGSQGVGHHTIAGLIQSGFGETVTLRGLPDGEVSISLHGLDYPYHLEGNARVMLPDHFIHTLAGDDELSVACELHRYTKVRVQAISPDPAMVPGEVSSNWLRIGDDAFTSRHLEFKSGAGELVEPSLALRPGHYLVLIHDQKLKRSNQIYVARESWCFMGEVDIPDQLPTGQEAHLVPVKFQRGARLQGIVIGRDGEPRRDSMVSMGPKAWSGSAHGPSTHTARTDGEGRFILHGLPPGTQFRAQGDSQVFVTGAAGSSTEVDVLFGRR